MTALGLAIGAVGVALIWGAITNENPLTVFELAISGKSTTKAKGFKTPPKPGGDAANLTPKIQAPSLIP